MANDNIYIFDAQTDEEIIRPMTDAEQAARDAEVATVTQAKADEEAEKTALEAKKQEVFVKLGLTADEVTALLA